MTRGSFFGCTPSSGISERDENELPSELSTRVVDSGDDAFPGPFFFRSFAKFVLLSVPLLCGDTSGSESALLTGGFFRSRSVRDDSGTDAREDVVGATVWDESIDAKTSNVRPIQGAGALG